MRIDYSDGSFMLAWSHCRAWFDKDGNFKDGEYKRKYRGRTIDIAISPKHTKVIRWLSMQGKLEIELINRGILKRK